jgi:hypothetical protein
VQNLLNALESENRKEQGEDEIPCENKRESVQEYMDKEEPLPVTPITQINSKFLEKK